MGTHVFVIGTFGGENVIGLIRLLTLKAALNLRSLKPPYGCKAQQERTGELEGSQEMSKSHQKYLTTEKKTNGFVWSKDGSAPMHCARSDPLSLSTTVL